jgi:hypothetical protein
MAITNIKVANFKSFKDLSPKPGPVQRTQQKSSFSV